jgi:hypothetical protein
MTAGWVAASTRGRALARRLVGHDSARALAAASWLEARETLAETMYGRQVPPGESRSSVRHAAMGATAWQLRVLAGWLPPGQGGLARLFAAPMEVANIEGHLARLAGTEDGEPPIRLGSLAVAWPRVAAATSPEQVRLVLATSVWGDPGGLDRASMALGLRLAWARRFVTQPPVVRRWAEGAAAVLVARERFGFGRTLNERTGRVADELLGSRWRDAGSIPLFVEALSESASWSLTGIEEAGELWRGEVAVVRRASADAEKLVSSGRHDRPAVVGIMAAMLVDLWRVLAVVEVVGRGPGAVEVFDAVA